MEKTESEISVPYSVFASKCPTRSVLDHTFSRLSVLILARLMEGPSRFNELARSVEGLSERMLSKSLKILEGENLIYRKDYNETPPRVEYGLTGSGERIAQSVLQVIRQMYVEMETKE